MYCQSCQTKLSPRDQRCPTCGRRVAASRDLGAGSSSAGDSKGEYPLPPASSLDEDSFSQNQPRPKATATASKEARPKAKEASPDRGESAERRKPSPPAPVHEPEPERAPGLRPQDVVALLVEQPSVIEPGLEIYSENGETIGVGYATAVGEIDLLARDDSGGWVVILVVGTDGGKELVGDLLQRIGWVRRHLGSSGEEVRGLVLLDSLPDDLGYAAAAVADTVEFKLYQLQLTFEPVIL